MPRYVHAEVGELAAQLQYTPHPLRKGHLERLAALIPELSPEQPYAYDYIFLRITGFEMESSAIRAMPGRDLHHDLGLLLRRFSLMTPLNGLDGDDPIVPREQIAAQCRVTPATLRRWGVQGLPLCCYLMRDGRRAWGVRRASLDRFLAMRKSRETAARRLDVSQREALVSRAAALTNEGMALANVVRTLAQDMGLSAGRIRQVLRRHGRAQEAAAGDDAAYGVCNEMAQLYRRSVSVREIAQRYSLTTAAVYHALHEALLREVMREKTAYIPSPEFADPDAEVLCLGAEGLFTYPPEEEAAPASVPDDLPPYLKELYGIPVLEREREAQLFRKYNYLKCRMAMLQEQIRLTGYRTGMIERFEELREAAEQARRILIRCNLRLVVSIAKRHTGPLANLLDLVSEGNMCLIRAVECYDYRREARFATYATWAVSKHFARVVPEENYRLSAFVTGQEAILAATGDASESARERSERVDHLRSVLARAVETLSERERAVVEAHYGTDGRPARTLDEIGRVFGVTRERIRQIEARALEKLRGVIGPEAGQAMA